MKSAHLNYVIAGLALLFCVLVFKGISYPLLWNDESETVMTGKNILKFGYPRMHDGKNFIFLPDGGRSGGTWIGYKPSRDTNITMPWGHYYFAAVGVFLAERVDDLYLKGGVIRSTFAVMGLAGLALFLLSFRDCFQDRKTYQRLIAVFLFLELFSVALLLHLREARYYSLVIFIVACFFYVFIRHGFNGRYPGKRYALLMALVLFCAYQVNVATFLACALTLFLHEAVRRVLDSAALMKGGKWTLADAGRMAGMAFMNLSPVLICGAAILPFVIYFETFATAAAAAKYYEYNGALFLEHLKRIYQVLSAQECLRWVIAVKVIHGVFWVRNLAGRKRNNTQEPAPCGLENLSLFMTLFSLSYCAMISRMPFPNVWTRYVIVLQPILILILLLDAVCIFRSIAGRFTLRLRRLMKPAFAGLMIIGFIVNMRGERIGNTGEYLFQITHQLKGPLDFIIPYIKEKYPHPDRLILATNYEELSYIYYLNCKVILGYVNKDYEEDMKLQPDIIVYRKAWDHNPAPYVQLLQRARYERVVFPVYDSGVNNIAEMDFIFEHQFRTRLPGNEDEASDIYIRMP